MRPITKIGIVTGILAVAASAAVVPYIGVKSWQDDRCELRKLRAVVAEYQKVYKSPPPFHNNRAIYMPIGTVNGMKHTLLIEEDTKRND